MTARLRRRLRPACARAALLFGLLLALAGIAPAVRAQDAATPVACRIGVGIESLHDFDPLANRFSALLWLWSVCPPGTASPLASMVFPDIQEDEADLGEIRESELADGSRYAYRRLHATFRFDWNMRDYPFDGHVLRIVGEETDLDATALVYAVDRQSTFLDERIAAGLRGWKIGDVGIEADTTAEQSSYGLPGAGVVSYARITVTVPIERLSLLPFAKLASGMFASALIALLALFFDPRDSGAFATQLGLLVAVLFAVLINMQLVDSTIGDGDDLTLMTKMHFVTVALIVALSLFSVRERRRVERGQDIRYPHWPMLLATASLYVVANAALVADAAWRG